MGASADERTSQHPRIATGRGDKKHCQRILHLFRALPGNRDTINNPDSYAGYAMNV